MTIVPPMPGTATTGDSVAVIKSGNWGSQPGGTVSIAALSLAAIASLRVFDDVKRRRQTCIDTNDFPTNPRIEMKNRLSLLFRGNLYNLAI